MKKQPTFTWIDGWNFGIGFFLAGIIGLPLIGVVLFTVIFVVVSIFGGLASIL